MKKSSRLNIRVTPAFADLLKAEAKRRGISQSDLIEEAVNELTKKPRPE